MTFQEYASANTTNERVISLIRRYRITEFTPYSHVIQCGGVGRHTTPIIEQLQHDYIKTFDVAYQQVIQYIRNEMIS